MRVLIATETYVPDVNGAAYFVQRLARSLVNRGHEVHVVCPAGGQERGQCCESARVHELPSRSVPRYPQLRIAQPVHARPAMRRVIHRINPDVVHVQNHFTVGRAAQAEARRSSVPVVGTNHFLPANLLVYLPVPAFLDLPIERLLWWQLRRVYGAMDIVTAPTTYAATQTARACRRDFEVISCGVDESVFTPDVSPTAFSNRYPTPEGPTLLAVGRLDPEKHLAELISALALVRDRVDAHLVLVGRGQQRSRLEKAARSHGVSEHVTFCGLVPDELMPAAYAAGDVYCHAGRAELQSISTLEAMASGKAIIAADAGALPLLVRNGVNGYLFPPGGCRALAERLLMVLEDDSLRSRMGQASRDAALDHGVERSASEFEAIYERAISSGRATTARERTGVKAPPHPLLSLEAAGICAALAVFALPVLTAFLRPEPSAEHTDIIFSYVLASLCAALSVRLLASVGLARMESIPRWLNRGPTQHLLMLLLSGGSALAVALGALVERGVLG